MPKVTIVDSETKKETVIKVGYGGNLRMAVAHKGVNIYKGMNEHLNCHGMGSCGTCLVEVDNMDHVSSHTLIEKLHKVEPGKKLACRTKVYGDITVIAKLVD